MKIKFSFTFYSKLINTFFGKTCESNSLELVLTPDQVPKVYRLKDEHPFDIYYHTILDPKWNIVIIMDAIIYEIGHNDVIFNSKSLGWIEIDALN